MDRAVAGGDKRISKKLRHRYAEKERQASDDEISHGVHVCELKEGEPDGCCEISEEDGIIAGRK